MCVVFFREQTPLEEGEIPWLMYNEDSGSSSDEDPDGVSQFVHPGLFILDGNNNLEDDSSMSEDLDTEWRSTNLIHNIRYDKIKMPCHSLTLKPLIYLQQSSFSFFT